MRSRNMGRGEFVAGEPMHIGERTLTPIARVAVGTRRRAVIGTQSEQAMVTRSAHVRPVAIIESTPKGTTYVVIRDETRRRITLIALLGAALVGACVLLTRIGAAEERRSPNDRAYPRTRG